MVDSQDTRPPARPLPTRFVAKVNSRLMRAIGAALGKSFMQEFWTTIGETIYVPSNALPLGSLGESYAYTDWQRTHAEAIAHETVHLRQFARWGVPLMAIAYALPYFRWRIERTAYLTNIMSQPPSARAREIDWVVDTLAEAYLRPWPKTWMRAWFVDAIAQGGQEK